MYYSKIKTKKITGKTITKILIFMILLVVLAYRACFVLGIQLEANSFCHARSLVVSDSYNNNDPIFNYANFYDACVTMEVESSRKVYFAFTKWSFEEIYPNIRQQQLFETRMEQTAKQLKAMKKK